jgi:hypothetical protein
MGVVACVCGTRHLRVRRCVFHRANPRRVLRAIPGLSGCCWSVSPIEHRQRHGRCSAGRAFDRDQGASTRSFTRIPCRGGACAVLSGGTTSFATKVVAGPLPIGRGHAVVEAFAEIGNKADAHCPEIRRALAAGLHAIVEACDPLVDATSLEPDLLGSVGEALWPTPHSKLFDFAATAKGAEWIDDVAARARERMKPAGKSVIGHGDWRAEHVRFLGDTPIVAFDWDSLCCKREPALIGAAAHGFCADWSRGDNRQAPSLDEARAFICDYERARGKMFSAGERRSCGACLAYASAYTARCGYAIDGDERETPGTFQHLVWSERDRPYVCSRSPRPSWNARIGFR